MLQQHRYLAQLEGGFAPHLLAFFLDLRLLDLRLGAARNELARAHGKGAGERLGDPSHQHRFGAARASSNTAYHAQGHKQAVERAEDELPDTTESFDASLLSEEPPRGFLPRRVARPLRGWSFRVAVRHVDRSL